MKSGIHPTYETAKITCACGRVTETRSTVGEIHVEICSHCHPFFTGRQKLVDTAGRVERFMAKYGDRATGGGATAEKPAPVEESAPAEESEATSAEAEAATPSEAAGETAVVEDAADAAEAASDAATDDAEAATDDAVEASADETES